eukprot:2562652-Pleurochrysis_carterae.AAC.1
MRVRNDKYFITRHWLVGKKVTLAADRHKVYPTLSGARSQPTPTAESSTLQPRKAAIVVYFLEGQGKLEEASLVTVSFRPTVLIKILELRRQPAHMDEAQTTPPNGCRKMSEMWCPSPFDKEDTGHAK